MLNEIYLRRKQTILISTREEKKPSKRALATLLKNIESLGYTFSKEAIDVLKTFSKEDLANFEKNTVKILKKMVGANVKYKPMYPNFPEQVMEASEAELYINAIIHYLTLGEWLPEYKEKAKVKIKDKLTLKVIKLGTKDNFREIFTNLVGSKVSVSATDKEDITWFVKQFPERVISLLPEKIANKENLGFVIGLLKDYKLLTNEVISKYFKTATDVLRLITALSTGDVSLSENTKFKRFSRPDRQLFLSMLENCGNAEDMLKYKYRWLRIGEILHPGEYRLKYPKAFTLFRALRDGEKIATFNSQFEKCISEQKLIDISKLAKTRPGEFARRLDWMFRTFGRNQQIINAFSSVAEKVSTTVLLQVREHYKTRNNQPYRIFIPKGKIAKIKLIDNELPDLQEQTCRSMVAVCDKALEKKFAKNEKLGNIYIDEKLKDYPVPFALRSASKALHTVSRGSRIDMEEGKNTVRMFIYWKNISGNKHGDNRVDVDLSGVFYKDDWEYLDHISYTNLKNDDGYHSGDITNAPKGASEFIDINIESALKAGARYAVMNVISFTGQPFSDIPICYAGCMMREYPKSGEIYDPKTVKNKFDLSTNSKYNVPLIFDLKERKIIWCDVALNAGESHWGRNVESNATGIQALGKALTSLSKPNLYDLFNLHAKARGKVVPKSKAKLVFSVEEGITPYDIEKITSEYL